MNIFVLNCGSSSIKFQLISMPEETVLVKGLVDGIAAAETFLLLEFGSLNKKIVLAAVDHAQALATIFKHLQQLGFDQKNIQIFGHRVVHGGELYRQPVRVTTEILKEIEALSDLAPLHNPANAAGIKACQQFAPNIANAAVFDTAFHQTLPPKAYLYGLPYELYEKFKIRKYGFHGISHQYVVSEAGKILCENVKDFKIISCHLGNGASVCAIEKGKSVEISMGFTPLEGLMMGTRAGSFDPEIILYLERKGYALADIENMMQKQGGLQGISQSSFDVRDLRQEELLGNPKSELAFEMFVYRVQRFIGSYAAVLGGLDVLIFTGGAGEKAYYLRRRICSQFGYLGLKLDMRKNRANEKIISSENSSVTTLVIPTNEELQIAREIYSLMK